MKQGGPSFASFSSSALTAYAIQPSACRKREEQKSERLKCVEREERRAEAAPQVIESSDRQIRASDAARASRPIHASEGSTLTATADQKRSETRPRLDSRAQKTG